MRTFLAWSVNFVYSESFLTAKMMNFWTVINYFNKMLHLIWQPARIYQLKVNKRNTRTRCEISSKLTIKTPEQRHWRPCNAIVNFEWVNAGWEVLNTPLEWNNFKISGCICFKQFTNQTTAKNLTTCYWAKQHAKCCWGNFG